MKSTRKRFAAPSLRGLLSTRQGALALAVVCAAAAAGLIAFAISQYRHSAARAETQATVLVATAEIPSGTSAEAIVAKGLYRVTPVLANQVTRGAIVNAGALSGEIAATNILPGQQLTTASFTTARGVGAKLGPSDRAVAVTLDAAHGLGGVAQAGDRVDVYGTFTVKATPVVELLVSDAVVLKTPGSGAAGTAASQAGTTLLGVNDVQAPELAYASDTGKIWLVLRPMDAANPSPGVTTLSSIMGAK